MEAEQTGCFETSLATITFEARLIVIRYRAKSDIGEADMHELVRLLLARTDARPRAFLIDIGGVRSVTRAARQVPATSEIATRIERLALLVASPLTRVIATFFLSVTGPKYPTRIFDDETKARAWLAQGEP